MNNNINVKELNEEVEVFAKALISRFKELGHIDNYIATEIIKEECSHRGINCD